VPAAAVIPAPIAYIKVVAVKKLVVEPLSRPGGPDPSWSAYCLTRPRREGVAPHGVARPSTVAGGSRFLGEAVCALNRVHAAGSQGFYLEKIRVFKAGNAFA